MKTGFIIGIITAIAIPLIAAVILPLVMIACLPILKPIIKLMSEHGMRAKPQEKPI